MFTTKTVDSVLKQFNKVVADLDEVMTNCESEEARQTRIIEDATASLEAAKIERQRATSVSTRIRALLSGPEEVSQDQAA